MLRNLSAMLFSSVESFLVAIVVCVIILSFLKCYFWKKGRRNPCVKTVPSPIKQVLLGLQNAKMSMGKNSTDNFVMLLSDTLVRYLSSAFKYVKLSHTNEEILAKFVHDVGNDWEVSSLLTEVFSIVDHVKFAKKKMSILQQRGVYKKTCLLILKISRQKGRRAMCK